MPGMLTASRLKCARLCQRMHKFRYADGWKTVAEAEPLRVGRLIHLALEAWWKEPAPENRLVAAVKALDEVRSDDFDYQRVRAMITGYDVRWGGETRGLEVLGVEVPFDVPLINPATGAASQTWTLAGKIDAVVRERMTGRIMIVEHKSASGDIAPGSTYWKRLKMDAQVSVYFAGAAAKFGRIDGCIYDVLGKPALRPYKATAPEDRKRKKDGSYYANVRLEDEGPIEFGKRIMGALADDPNRYYVRGEVMRLESEMDEAMADIWALGKMLREQELAGRYPRNADACIQYERECDYFGVCCGEESFEANERFVRLVNMHPELPGEEVSK